MPTLCSKMPTMTTFSYPLIPRQSDWASSPLIRTLQPAREIRNEGPGYRTFRQTKSWENGTVTLIQDKQEMFMLFIALMLLFNFPQFTTAQIKQSTGSAEQKRNDAIA